MEVVASLSQGRTAAAQWGLFTHKSVPVIFEPPCIYIYIYIYILIIMRMEVNFEKLVVINFGLELLIPVDLRSYYCVLQVLCLGIFETIFSAHFIS